ncbi:MAG: PocR ligand-binding domain-containing protein [Clostridia bacterium]|nr:PocR ligand-binding domain-containing protein [Clostridia bacterium]
MSFNDFESDSSAFLDIDMVKLIAQDYHASTGINCSFIKSDGDILFESRSLDVSCRFCNKLHIINKTEHNCTNVHLYGMQEAERFGGKYIYFCPAGITWFISPMTYRESTVGALLGGPLMMCDRQDYIEFDLVQKNNIPKAAAGAILEDLQDIPVVSPERVSSLSNMLYASAGFLSSYDAQGSQSSLRKASQQQGEIGEYIKSLKLVSAGTSPSYPLDKENGLLAAITEGDKQQADKLLNEILGYIFFSSGGSFEIIRARVLELVVLLSRAALSGGADIERIFGLNYKYISEINQFKNVDDLCFWLTEIMNKFMNYIFRFNEVKHLDVIYKTVDFVRRNYMNKITLEDVANFVYLSPSYFSKVFKDEMKSNFNAYLNSVRIEQSKKLLLSDAVKLVDVAGMVGFEDQSYFSKVFKKLAGVTPKRYREARGKVKSRVFEDETL